MTTEELQEFALAEYHRMTWLASEYQQMGFTALAAFLREQARKALLFAAKEARAK